MSEVATVAKERAQDRSVESAPQVAPAPQSTPTSSPMTAPAGAAAFYDGPKGVQARVPNNATNAQGQQLSFADLSATQKASIRAAVNRAKGMIAPALRRLNAAKSAVDSVVQYAFKVDGTDSDDKKAIDKAIENFNKVSAALNGNLSFEGENSPAENGTVTLAYVYTGFIGLFDGSIHICFPGWDQLSDTEKSATIIHELTHQKCGTDDNAYMHERAKWRNMDMKAAVNNADSYAYMVLHA